MGGYTKRQAVASWARSYPFAPRYADAEPVGFEASDGTPLSGWWLAGPLTNDAPAAVVVAHGVMHHSRNPRILAFCERLARELPVLAVDLRGHGRSGGSSTLGTDEPLDLVAAVAEAKRRCGLPVVTVGVSLGGASALLGAGRGGGVAGVVAVSAPAFTEWNRPGAARLYRFARSRSGRAISSVVLQTRIAPRFGAVAGAAEAVSAIAPGWIVLVHDPYDHYFGPEHPETIRSWATGPVEIWWEPGGGHGTDLLDAGLAARVVDTIRARLG